MLRAAAQRIDLRARQNAYVQLLVISDALVLCGVVASSQLLRFGNHTVHLMGRPSVQYSWLSLLIVVVWMMCLHIFKTHSLRFIGLGTEEYRRVWTATFAMFGGVAIVSTALRLEVARGYLAIAFPLGLIALTASRRLMRRYIAWQQRHGRFVHAIVLVGQLEAVREFAQSPLRYPTHGYKVVAVCTPDGDPGDAVELPGFGEVPLYPQTAGVANAVDASGADTVALLSGQLTPDEIRDLSWQLEKLNVDLVVSPGMVDVAGPRLTLLPTGGLPLIFVDKPQYEGAKRFQKRAFDVCFSLALLLCAAPLMVAAAVRIKAYDGGPVFYLSERIGLDGVPFQMIKFRTMVVCADRQLASLAHLSDSDGALFKMRQDPRITPVGRVLRRYSIDELPQFINVLRGEMSVVGPRPPLACEVDAYDARVRRRLLVRPGITGLWQISGRSDLSWEDSVRLDLSYVENWSMLADFAIAAGTLGAVVRARGAY